MTSFEKLLIIYGTGVVVSFLLGLIFVKSYKWIMMIDLGWGYFLDNDTTYVGLIKASLFSWGWVVCMIFDWLGVIIFCIVYTVNLFVNSHIITSMIDKINSLNRKINK